MHKDLISLFFMKIFEYRKAKNNIIGLIGKTYHKYFSFRIMVSLLFYRCLMITYFFFRIILKKRTKAM